MLLTNLSRDNMISGSTDVAAIASLARAFPGLQVRFLPSLHAKVYLSESEAIVTSANMTQSGFSANFEYGVRFTDTRTLQRVRQDVMEYAALASPVDAERLAILEEATEHVRRLSTKAQASLKRALRREFEQKVREIDDEVLRIRTAGRAAHAIFADAILYVLRRGPASTAEIHQAIRHIHPDLCDDTEDRVIDGRHFGKKWKHAVRTAQQYLKRQGLVELADRTWRLI